MRSIREFIQLASISAMLLATKPWNSIAAKQKLKIDVYAPMGSINDNLIEKFVKKNKLNFFKLSDRHFKH